jgi:alkylhydroperoxidase family enzyme
VSPPSAGANESWRSSGTSILPRLWRDNLDETPSLIVARHQAFTDLEKAVLRLARDATRARADQPADRHPVHAALGDERCLALLFSIGWYNMTARVTSPAALQLEPDLDRL